MERENEERRRKTNAIFLAGLKDLSHGVRTLGDIKVAPVLAEFDDRAACDSRKDRTIERSGDELSLSLSCFPEDKEVHCADLCAVVLRAKQPQKLLVSHLGSKACWLDRWGVVAVFLFPPSTKR
jgi:hypothetical protein